MAEASTRLMLLRPVTFRYRKNSPDSERRLQYGLIAEEVAEVYPDLVVYSKTGEAQTLQYHKVNAMLLNEVQKQHGKIQKQEKLIAMLAGRLDALEAERASVAMAR